MSKTKQNIQTQYLGIHYYFNDDSHSMDARIRNQMEKDYLDIITEIAKILGVEVKLESQAREEGGIIDILNIDIQDIVVASIMFLAPAINKIATYYFTGQYKNDRLDNKLKELKIKEYESENQTNSKLQDLSNKINESHKIKRLLSNLYKKAGQCTKIVKIGYIDYENKKKIKEEIVERKDFSNFIIDTNSDIEIDDEATIEIISPVLKEGRYKWRGIYNNEKIDFSMGDFNFKSAVVEKRHNFENGSTIICRLEIKNTFDEFGEKTKNTNYRVAKVYEIIKNDIAIKTNAGHKKYEKDLEAKQGLLFYFGDDNATK